MAGKHNPLQVQHLQFLKEGVQFIEAHEPSLIDLASQLPLDNLQRLCGEDFSWAYLYELPMKHSLILFLSLLGVLPAITSAIDAGLSLSQAIIDHVKKIQTDPEAFVNEFFNIDKEPSTMEEIRGLRIGAGGCFSLNDFFVLMNAIKFQTKALRKYGKSLSELVDDVRHGKDESFWLAVQIDPTILSCQVFSRRMSIASMQNNYDFFRLIGNAVKIKEKKTKNELDPLRVILHACNEAGWLDDMAQDKADKLFIQELQAYSNDGDDPARGLYKFIYRWKKTL